MWIYQSDTPSTEDNKENILSSFSTHQTCLLFSKLVRTRLSMYLLSVLVAVQLNRIHVNRSSILPPSLPPPFFSSLFPSHAFFISQQSHGLMLRYVTIRMYYHTLSCPCFHSIIHGHTLIQSMSFMRADHWVCHLYPVHRT